MRGKRGIHPSRTQPSTGRKVLTVRSMPAALPRARLGRTPSRSTPGLLAPADDSISRQPADSPFPEFRTSLRALVLRRIRNPA
jgi:hypothetical protein